MNSKTFNSSGFFRILEALSGLMERQKAKSEKAPKEQANGKNEMVSIVNL